MKGNKPIFRRQIVKSGDSFQVVIPPEIIEGMGLRLHQQVTIEPMDKGIFIRVEEEE